MVGADPFRWLPKAAENESEAQLRLLLGTQAIWETDADGVVVADSPSWRAYTGQTVEEWLGYGWLDAIHPDDRAYAERQWREAIAARALVDAEFRLRAPDGGWRWTNFRAAPVLDAEGGIQKWAGMNIDIDTRKQAEAALRESEAKFRTIFEASDQGFVIIEMIPDASGRLVDYRYVEVNSSFEKHTGLSGVVGKLGSEVSPTETYWLDVFRDVALTGRGQRHENFHEATQRWYDIYCSRVAGTGLPRIAGVFSDVTGRKCAEKALRESETRQAFLLRLSDVLRRLSQASDIQMTASRLLGDQLNVSRTMYAEVIGDGETGGAFIRGQHVREGEPFPERIPSSMFDETFVEGSMWTDDRVVMADIECDPRIREEARRAWLAGGIAAAVAVALVKDGRLVAIFGVHHAHPRHWSAEEVALVEEVAERTWAAAERARAEAALRESEERFRQFAHAAAEGAWIRDAGTLDMEYVSPAASRIYGAEPQGLLDGVQHWAGLILPEDREVALAHLERARQGEVVAHEFRIQRPSDGAFRWIRSVDFPLLDSEGRVQRIGGLSEDVTEAKLAVEHQGVLLAELEHRVRNIMAMIRSIVGRSADGAANTNDYRKLLDGRLLALARVQALLTRQANAGGSLRDIIESEVSAQAHSGAQFELVGPDVHLSPKAVEVLTLALHELATNALKYGALSVSGGWLRVEWAPFEKRGRTWLVMEWTEQGAPSRGPVTRRGFGSDLIEGKIPYELGGSGRISIEPGGAHCRLEFPLKEGESILETDAPSPTAVFGGTLDMTGAPDLTGRSVLVVEDDYYLASDTAAALRGAGATVLGPCPSEDATLDLLEIVTPTHAVLDLNLGGGGPRFAIAETLKARDVPFMFVTGYDPDAVPPGLADVVRLQKPVSLRTIVDAVAQL